MRLLGEEFPSDKRGSIEKSVRHCGGRRAGRHTDPGIETSYVIEGAMLVKVAGRGWTSLHAT
jgi:hypothetical protein